MSLLLAFQAAPPAPTRALRALDAPLGDHPAEGLVPLLLWAHREASRRITALCEAALSESVGESFPQCLWRSRDDYRPARVLHPGGFDEPVVEIQVRAAWPPREAAAPPPALVTRQWRRKQSWHRSST